MARLPRVILPDVPIHHIQRGNNRQPIFVDERDRWQYRQLLIEGSRQFSCAIHAWVFMTNHVHLLLTPAHPQSVASFTQWLGRRYVPWFNRRHGRTGTLWEGRFRSSIIDSSRYFITCSRYIDQNPVRAGLCRSITDYSWSSYARLASGVPDDLVTEHEQYRALGASPIARQQAYRQLCDPPLESDVLTRLRHLIKRGEVMGGPDLASTVARRHGRPRDRSTHGGDRRSARYRRSASINDSDPLKTRSTTLTP